MIGKLFYRKIIYLIENLSEKLNILKTSIAEEIAITRKSSLYSCVSWNIIQIDEFNNYWKKYYGRTIPNKWHRLYESINGTYRADYVPEKLFSTKLEPALNDYRYCQILQDKNLLESLFQECGCIVPQTVLSCSNGIIKSKNNDLLTRDDAIKILVNSKDIIVKKASGSSSGKDVFFYNESLTQQQAQSLIDTTKYDFIVQERIKANKVFSKFNTTSVNTIRIITYILNGEIKHCPICFRIGRINAKVDNVHMGGVVVGVKDDGTLSPVAYELGYGNKSIKHTFHPDSKEVFEGTVLPNIQRIIQSAYKCHKKLVRVGVVSWDFTVDSEGAIVLIEANMWAQSSWFPQIASGRSLFGDDTKSVLLKLRDVERSKR